MVVRPSKIAATMSNSIRENADWRVAQDAGQRIRAPGQRPFVGLRFIIFLYFTLNGEAMQETGGKGVRLLNGQMVRRWQRQIPLTPQPNGSVGDISSP